MGEGGVCCCYNELSFPLGAVVSELNFYCRHATLLLLLLLPPSFSGTPSSLPLGDDTKNGWSRLYSLRSVFKNFNTNNFSHFDFSLATKWRMLTRDAQTFVSRSFSLSRNKKKCQLFVAHSFWVIYQNVSRTFAELCMATPYWSTVLLHQYGRRKSTKTSGAHLFYKSSFFSLEN